MTTMTIMRVENEQLAKSDGTPVVSRPSSVAIMTLRLARPSHKRRWPGRTSA